jgi:hypothetical protein
MSASFEIAFFTIRKKDRLGQEKRYKTDSAATIKA